jgi:hypothetical protein
MNKLYKTLKTIAIITTALILIGAAISFYKGVDVKLYVPNNSEYEDVFVRV